MQNTITTSTRNTSIKPVEVVTWETAVTSSPPLSELVDIHCNLVFNLQSRAKHRSHHQLQCATTLRHRLESAVILVHETSFNSLFSRDSPESVPYSSFILWGFNSSLSVFKPYKLEMSMQESYSIQLWLAVLNKVMWWMMILTTNRARFWSCCSIASQRLQS